MLTLMLIVAVVGVFVVVGLYAASRPRTRPKADTQPTVPGGAHADEFPDPGAPSPRRADGSPVPGSREDRHDHGKP